MRLSKVAVSTELMMDIMTRGWNTQFTECVEGIPEDSKFSYSYSDDNTGRLYFVVEHETFLDLKIGDDIPELRATFKKWYFPEVAELLQTMKSTDQQVPYSKPSV